MKHRKFNIILNSMTLIIFIFFSLFHAQNAYSSEIVSEADNRQLRYDLKLDLTVTAITATGFLITTAFENQLAPSSCRWCEVNGLDDWGHRNFAWSNNKAANLTSHVTAFALAPMSAFGLQALAASHDHRLNEFAVDALIIAEAASSAAMLTQILKFSTGRQRPYAHYAPSQQFGPKSNTSFYSAHTSTAFALAVSSGTVASMRGYKLAPFIWGSGLAIATLTGYLRLAADRHYLTDVITGTVIGSAMGFGIPYLFHKPRKSAPPKVMPSVATIDNGGIVSVTGNF